MPRTYISLNDTNKAIRAALRDAYPGVKFSVRGSKHAGGASTKISWTDGPAVRDVHDFVQQFAGASFDGMTDMKSYVSGVRGGEDVHWGADFVFTSRNLSPKRTAELIAEVAGMLGLSAEDFAASLDTYREVPHALWKAGMTRSCGSESGHAMVRALGEIRAAAPQPRRSSGEWTDEETHTLAGRAA